MSNKDKNLREIMHSKGFLFPRDADDLIDFQQNADDANDKPKDWENPISIILRGKMELKNFHLSSIPNQELQNLAMAAREGKSISSDVRKKMDEDRKNAKK